LHWTANRPGSQPVVWPKDIALFQSTSACPRAADGDCPRSAPRRPHLAKQIQSVPGRSSVAERRGGGQVPCDSPVVWLLRTRSVRAPTDGPRNLFHWVLTVTGQCGINTALRFRPQDNLPKNPRRALAGAKDQRRRDHTMDARLLMNPRDRLLIRLGGGVPPSPPTREERAGERRAVSIGFPLSLALSPLLRRDEREFPAVCSVSHSPISNSSRIRVAHNISVHGPTQS